jgi:hypothetical protein
MNAVVLDALNIKMTLSLNEQMNKKHDAAVKQAIFVADVPRGTQLILQSASPGMKTDILIKAPADADYSLLARVHGDEVTFADDLLGNIPCNQSPVDKDLHAKEVGN